MSASTHRELSQEIPSHNPATNRLSRTPRLRDRTNTEKRYILEMWLDLSKSAAHGSIVVSTLIAGFTFNTLLGQAFQPRYLFDESEVQLLLALTFLFSALSILFAGYVLWALKFLPFNLKAAAAAAASHQDMVGVVRCSVYALSFTFATLAVTSASFVTLSLAITAFQKAVGSVIVAVTSLVTLNLVMCTVYTAVQAHGVSDVDTQEFRSTEIGEDNAQNEAGQSAVDKPVEDPESVDKISTMV